MNGAIALTSPPRTASPARCVASRDDGSGWLKLFGPFAASFQNSKPQICPLVNKIAVFPKYIADAQIHPHVGFPQRPNERS